MSRVFSAILLLGLLAVAIWVLPPWATAVVAVVASALAAGELAALATHVGAPSSAAHLAIAAGAACAAFGWRGAAMAAGFGDPFPPVLLVTTIAAGLLALAAG